MESTTSLILGNFATPETTLRDRVQESQRTSERQDAVNRSRNLILGDIERETVSLSQNRLGNRFQQEAQNSLTYGRPQSPFGSLSGSADGARDNVVIDAQTDEIRSSVVSQTNASRSASETLSIDNPARPAIAAFEAISGFQPEGQLIDTFA